MLYILFRTKFSPYFTIFNSLGWHLWSLGGKACGTRPQTWGAES